MFDKLFMSLQILRGSFGNAHADEEGATGVEYGIMIAAIAAVIIALAFAIGDQIVDAFSTVLENLGGDPDNV